MIVIRDWGKIGHVRFVNKEFWGLYGLLKKMEIILGIDLFFMGILLFLGLFKGFNMILLSILRNDALIFITVLSDNFVYKFELLKIYNL